MSDNTWDMWDGNNYIRKLADKYGIERSQPTYSKSIEIMKAQEEALSAARAEGYREGERDGAVKALGEAKAVVNTEFERWLEERVRMLNNRIAMSDEFIEEYVMPEEEAPHD